jgi:hypothetical protein
MIVEAHRRVCILTRCIGDVVVVVIDVVVIQLDMLQTFFVHVLDFCDAYHEYFSLQREVFYFWRGLTFFVRRIERPAFLEREFAGIGSGVE